jgi:uncharacterized protein YjbI with pentapeptide repeats
MSGKVEVGPVVSPECRTLMGYGVVCQRPVHDGPADMGGTPVCLMHSSDPEKFRGGLFEKFWEEFEGMLVRVGSGEALFDRFVFPRISLRNAEITAKCSFRYAVFAEVGDFREVKFTQHAQFSKARFKQFVCFSGASFAEGADFSLAEFSEDADFASVRSEQSTNFSGAKFEQSANFSRATFLSVSDSLANNFLPAADFSGTTFMKTANFAETMFSQIVDFRDVTFSETAYFVGTRFSGTAIFRRSSFLEGAHFRQTGFTPQSDATSAVFELVKFSAPEEIVFDDVDLSCALFHKSDVSDVWFSSSVRWGRRGPDRGVVIYEETIDLSSEDAKDLQKDGQRDYSAVAQIYQQLKKNYDSRLDYWTANQFHFGELEMQRLVVPTEGRFLALRKWLHPRFSLLAWYRYASDYGNSYGKPMLWLLGVLVLSAVLLPCLGLSLGGRAERLANQTQIGCEVSETYRSVWQPGSLATKNLLQELHLVGRSLLTVLDAATFQKNPEYVAKYPLGRVLILVQTLLTSTLFALFLLAIRRQFRR